MIHETLHKTRGTSLSYPQKEIEDTFYFIIKRATYETFTDDIYNVCRTRNRATKHHAQSKPIQLDNYPSNESLHRKKLNELQSVCKIASRN